ncbi:MAG TPA: DNA mismatch repair protein MutS, partial [Thermoanaerobaculia bacterium]|nr:DNA mismatch repair protein MutS [Thermoanaerobaculia bacterium]
MPKIGQLTPMLRHYLEVKSAYPDAILLYRMGDFYEMFFADAERAAPVLEVALTARQKGSESEAPMCGVPHHALATYAGKLLKAGLKVAICDQVEDPKTAKGLVKREVTRVLTPGTISDPRLLDSREENLLATLVWSGDEGAGAFLDVSTGSFTVRRWPAVEAMLADLRLFVPKEVLCDVDDMPPVAAAWIEREVKTVTARDRDRWLEPRRSEAFLKEHFAVGSLKGFGLKDGEPALEAAALALAYARSTQHNDLQHIQRLKVSTSAEGMVVDATTLANLEVFETLREGPRRATLIGVLGETVTPGGGRLLRQWLRRPLMDRTAIEERLAAVDALLSALDTRRNLRQRFARVTDLERCTARAVLGTVGPREMRALCTTLAVAPDILAELGALGAPLLSEIGGRDPLFALHAELERCLENEPAATPADGRVIASGVDEELDRCRSLAHDTKQHILEIERRERERTGIASLKVRYNKVFGYFIEVTKANQHLVPEDYVRRQTLANSERYVTEEVKELEERILAAEQRRLELEFKIYKKLVELVAGKAEELGELARSLATADVLATFAEVAERSDYHRPQINDAGGRLLLADNRHPVVETLGREPFVPNDLVLDGDEARIVILTGPNMGGKSTYLRQIALAVLMAHCGCFIAASKAEIPVCDRIFTRVGASDDLARGESTFMVEMIETANILHQATARSLVILDEVGRGTATFDGLSLAWAIVEHIQSQNEAKTLFATHYHELTELASLLPGVVNRTMAVKEWDDKIVFLRRVIPGSADKSYGLHVARLAGVPVSVIERAGEVLANLEAQQYSANGVPKLAEG